MTLRFYFLFRFDNFALLVAILLKKISAAKLLKNLVFHRIKSFNYHYYHPKPYIFIHFSIILNTFLHI